MTNIVLITNFARPRLLAQTLETLHDRTYTTDFSLTVICDGLPSDEQVRNMGPRGKAAVISVNPASRIIGRLKNLGAYWSEKQFGRGEYLCFLDDDMALFPGWLDKMVATVWQPVPLIGGVRHPYHGVNQICDPVYGFPGASANPLRSSIEVTDAVAGYCHFMRWSTWDRYGPYDAHAKGTGQSEDWKLCNDIVKDGGRVGYIHPPVMAHAGITNSEGKPAIGSEQIARVPGVLYE